MATWNCTLKSWVKSSLNECSNYEGTKWSCHLSLFVMNFLKWFYQELFSQHVGDLFSSPILQQAGKQWKRALVECQSVTLTAETGFVGKVVVRAGPVIRVPAGSFMFVSTHCCQGMLSANSSVFLEPPTYEEGALSANILISQCLLPVECLIVYIPAINLWEKSQWFMPKTLLGQHEAHVVDVQSTLVAAEFTRSNKLKSTDFNQATPVYQTVLAQIDRWTVSTGIETFDSS